uniref:Uncharacterized protein n=1 Tax=Magnetococcus massalia (strain MO-1) TaxID=451514 RepID=A0A1S7LIN5_MAGMO|nr:protein of unknown function [Candidatus Magnetococcus massalia]
MRIIIIDHALTKKLGHFYGMHKGLRQLFSDMGIPWRVRLPKRTFSGESPPRLENMLIREDRGQKMPGR